MMLIRTLLIFLLMCSTAFGATEFIYPTAGAGWDTGDHDDIDECDTAPTCTPDDGTQTSTNKAAEAMTSGTFSDLVTADADDTYNSVTVFFRSHMTGTVNDEIVALTVTDATTVTEIDGANGTPATDNSGDISGYHSFAAINALTYSIIAEKTGAESVTLWTAQTLWVVVDYTAVAGPTQFFYVTWLENIKDFFVRDAHAGNVSNQQQMQKTIIVETPDVTVVIDDDPNYWWLALGGLPAILLTWLLRKKK